MGCNWTTPTKQVSSKTPRGGSQRRRRTQQGTGFSGSCESGSQISPRAKPKWPQYLLITASNKWTNGDFDDEAGGKEWRGWAGWENKLRGWESGEKFLTKCETWYRPPSHNLTRKLSSYELSIQLPCAKHCARWCVILFKSYNHPLNSVILPHFINDVTVLRKSGWNDLSKAT